MRFGDRFRAFLRARGLTQVEAAKLLGMRQGTVSYYCNVDHAPRPHILRHIADRLGVGVADLMGEKTSVRSRIRLREQSPITSSPQPNGPFSTAAKNLKRRWKKKPHERDAIRHLVAVLFLEDAKDILAWLERGSS